MAKVKYSTNSFLLHRLLNNPTTDFTNDFLTHQFSLTFSNRSFYYSRILNPHKFPSQSSAPSVKSSTLKARKMSINSSAVNNHFFCPLSVGDSYNRYIHNNTRSSFKSIVKVKHCSLTNNNSLMTFQ